MKITVFTPTYNRLELLETMPYKSLLEQTFHDFEWVVVDDGSADATPELLSRIEAEGKLNMRWIRQKNAGRQNAINRGVREAQGELFLILDSDEMLLPDSLEQVWRQFEAVRDDELFVGVCGWKADLNGKKLGSPAFFDTFDASSVEMTFHHGMRGDMAEIFRTSVWRQYPYPVFEGEKFIYDGISVYRMSGGGRKLRYFNRNIILTEYFPDGQTTNKVRTHRTSPRGTMTFYAFMARLSGSTTMSKIKAAIIYWRYTLDYKGAREQKLPLWGYALWPAGLVFFLNDKRKR